MFTANEIPDRTRGISSGAPHALVRQVGLLDASHRRLHLLKLHFPFYEADHVLTFAYNAPPRNRDWTNNYE